MSQFFSLHLPLERPLCENRSVSVVRLCATDTLLDFISGTSTKRDRSYLLLLRSTATLGLIKRRAEKEDCAITSTYSSLARYYLENAGGHGGARFFTAAYGQRLTVSDTNTCIFRFILVTRRGMHASFTSDIFTLLALAAYYRKQISRGCAIFIERSNVYAL